MHHTNLTQDGTSGIQENGEAVFVSQELVNLIYAIFTFLRQKLEVFGVQSKGKMETSRNILNLSFNFIVYDDEKQKHDDTWEIERA